MLVFFTIVILFQINISWDETGNYDIPAVINYILDRTGQSKLSYVGYSLGSALFFIAMSTHPELNSKIETMVFKIYVSNVYYLLYYNLLFSDRISSTFHLFTL